MEIAYCLILFGLIYFAVKMVAREQALKAKYGGVNLVQSDLRFEGVTLQKVLFLAFLGGWVAGALGLGGGSIFNPLLISMGVPPKVSSATGMYLVTFSKISACLIYYLSGELNIRYALWISFWSTVGSIIGLWLTELYMKRSGR